MYLRLYTNNIKNSTMRLNKSDREEFRKKVKISIPQMKKSETVNHFQKEC